MEKPSDFSQNQTLPQSKIYLWAIQKANSSKAPFWIGLLFLLEIILFIPLDPILLFFFLQNRSKIFIYTIVAAVASVCSSLIGYLAGHFLWHLLENWIIPHLISQSHFLNLSTHLEYYQHWAVFFGMLLPFPLKALSLTAGVFDLGLTSFVLYAFLARMTRFLFVGTLAFVWGKKVELFFERHFHSILLIILAKALLFSSLFWLLAS